MYKKILAVFCVFSIFFSIPATASADLSDAQEYAKTTFFEYLDYLGHIIGNDEFRVSEWWKALTDAEDPKAKYNSHVADLPATGVGSDGYLYWIPDYSSSFVRLSVGNLTRYYYWGDTTQESGDIIFDFLVSSDHDPCEFSLYPGGASSAILFSQSFEDIAPVSGYYFIPNVYDRTGYYIDKSVRHEVSPYHSSYGSESDFYQEGSSFAGTYGTLTTNVTSSDFLSLTFYCKPIRIQPLSGLIDPVSDTTYNIDSRPTSITGDYGIIGDNGQISNVGNTTIVNETNNTFTNPSTGTTSTITEWTYDYSDRSYNLTLDTGDTVTVTYGDENVTIQEGDTIYNVYYIINGSGEGTDPDACQHDYTSTVDREAACTVPGQKTYTCSLCGDTYTEAIPAKGHSWTVLQTVTTEYDEQGSLIRQGYTLYECSVCGEQYKDETGTGPPDSGGGAGPGEDGESVWDKLGQFLGTVFGGFIGFVEAFLGAVLDALISLATMIGEKTAAVVELILRLFTEIPLLFTGFLSFLSAVFPFFPEEIMLLLTFGIAVVVFIGIIKELRR